MKNCVIHRSLNDDDDFEESIYKKQNTISPKKKPDATHTGDVKRKKNTSKTVSSSAAVVP
jgi:hypothetical protein